MAEQKNTSFFSRFKPYCLTKFKILKRIIVVAILANDIIYDYS